MYLCTLITWARILIVCTKTLFQEKDAGLSNTQSGKYPIWSKRRGKTLGVLVQIVFVCECSRGEVYPSACFQKKVTLILHGELQGIHKCAKDQKIRFSHDITDRPLNFDCTRCFSQQTSYFICETRSWYFQILIVNLTKNLICGWSRSQCRASVHPPRWVDIAVLVLVMSTL